MHLRTHFKDTGKSLHFLVLYKLFEFKFSVNVNPSKGIRYRHSGVKFCQNVSKLLIGLESDISDGGRWSK